MNTEEKLSPKFMGYFWSNLFGFLTIGITKYFITDTHGEVGGVFIFSEFVIVPVLMGMISGWFWYDSPSARRKLLVHSVANTFIAILLSYVFLREGVICLLIVSPLIFCFLFLGAVAGRSMHRHRNGRLNASIVIVLIAVFFVDAFSTHQYENEVSDTIVIHAPPGKVWQNVVAFKRIHEPAKFWLFEIGLPNPVESTVTGYYKGAGRKCIFSNNYVFDEVISTYDVGKNLTFDITNEPRDPEIMRHIDIERGQFLLKDNGDGTTTLTGNSWYRLYVFPAWYYDLWAKSIVRNVHTRVMKHIKELSEQ